MSEQYQFLRYYIPGSLSLMYFFALILASIDGKVFHLLFEKALLSSVIGVFAISPAVGYVIYQFYDWILYNTIAKCEKRRTLSLIDEWADKEKFPKGELWEVKRKELIDFALYTSLKEIAFQISDQLTETIRGFWSHVNARLVSSIFAPLASLILFAIFLAIARVLNLSVTFNVLNNAVTFLLIGILSICIGYPAKRTIREAFVLEEYVIRAREQVIRNYLRLETEKKPSCIQLKDEFKNR